MKKTVAYKARLKASVLGASFLALATTAAGVRAAPASTVSEEEAHAIAVDAYLYFYPLVTMEVTRRQFTNQPPGSPMGGPMNTLVNVRSYPPADARVVVRPNFDTLYSVAYIDVREEPMVLSVPDTHGRYYLMPLLDMWTDVFASPGWRTTGTQAGTFLMVPQGSAGDGARLVGERGLPTDTQVLEAPTPVVWLIGRTRTDGPADYAAVHAIQDGYRLTKLSQWGKAPNAPAFTPDPSVDMQTPPKSQVDTMPADRYFALAADLLKTHPPHATDQPMLARLRRIGFEAGRNFDAKAQDPAIQRGIEQAAVDGQKLMQWKAPTIAQVVNGWSMNTDTMGVYGNYYLKRAMVAQLGLGANVPEDAIYPLNLGDGAGQPLDGTKSYRLHFGKDDLPPVEAFWSVTLYDSDGFQVPNALDRFALSSWMPFAKNGDGSLDLLIQADSPGTEREANWLPAPKAPFNLTMRLYAPQQSVLTGQWSPPPVERVEKKAGVE